MHRRGASSKCMRVRDGADQPWRIFHGQIEGFTFEPGYRYRLQVTRRPSPTRPPTASPSAPSWSRWCASWRSSRRPIRSPARSGACTSCSPAADAETHAPDGDDHAGDRHPVPNGPPARAAATAGSRPPRCDGLELELTGMGATMMACPPPAMDEERAFLDGHWADRRATRSRRTGSRSPCPTAASMRFRELID